MGSLYRQGEHICSLYETADEQLSTAAAYLADGLRSGDQVAYVAESEAAFALFRAALTREGIDVAPQEKRCAILFLTHAETYVMDGVFECDRMLARVSEAIEKAVGDGFRGLRACGDMSWLLLEPQGAENVLEYEARLNYFFQRSRGAAMCQYDRRVAPRFLDHALSTHPSVVVDGVHKANCFFRPPEIARRRKATGDDIAWKLAELRTA